MQNAMTKQKNRIDLNALLPDKYQSFDLFSLLNDLPIDRDSVSVFSKINNISWKNEDLKNRIVEHTKGFILSAQNKLKRQAKLHLREVEKTYNYNCAEISVDVLKQQRIPAKLFAVTKINNRPFKIQSAKYTWINTPITQSEEIIPSKYLHRLTLIRSQGVEPTCIFVGVPFDTKYSETNFQIIANEIRKSIEMATGILSSGSEIYSELSPLDDPVLLLAFGKNPSYLVEIARWI